METQERYEEIKELIEAIARLEHQKQTSDKDQQVRLEQAITGLRELIKEKQEVTT